MKADRSYKNVLFIVALFLISVAVRLPNLNRPVSKHHEFNTAFFLIPMEIWQKDGIVFHGFIPPYNYTNENDKYISDPIGIEDGNKNGTYYYLSLPSLSYVAPYVALQLFSLPVSPPGLQIFNLTLHLLLCVLLFRLFTMTINRTGAYIGTVFYLFSPATLWFHGNGYTHHVFSQVLVVAAIYFLLDYLKREKKYTLIVFAFAVFFLFLTEWISVFLAAVIFVISIVKFRSSVVYRNVLIALIVSSILAFVIFVVQYGWFFGWDNYRGYLFNRFSYRSTIMNHSIGFFDQIWSWIKWTVVSYGAWMMLLVIMALYLIKQKVKTGLISLDSNQKQLLVLLLIPVFAYHFVFMEFTSSHDYSVLVDGLLWSFCLAFLSSKVHGILKSKKIITAGIVIIVFISIGQYYVINRPGKYNQNGDPYDIYQSIGETVKKTALPDETIFMTGFDNVSINKNNPQIIYYAKRSIKSVTGEDEAYRFMQQFNRKKGKLYVLKNKKVHEIKELEF